MEQFKGIVVISVECSEEKSKGKKRGIKMDQRGASVRNKEKSG